MTTEGAQNPLRILAIDDEQQIHRLLTIALEAEGYRVMVASAGQEGLALAARHRHDLIIIDLGLPDINGLLVLKQIREWTNVPIIILTVENSEEEKIGALDGGADDYVTKPFNTGELLARIRANLRRSNEISSGEPVFRSGGLEVDLVHRRVTCNGQPVKLTATEYQLLHLFIKHVDKVLTHRQILREVWGTAHEENTQYLRVYMARLREKLETNPDDAPLFVTEPGVGYRLVEA